MKKNILLFGLIFASAASGYTAAPSEFPHTFIRVAQKNVDHAMEMVQDLDALSGVIKPISLMSNYASLKTVRNKLAELERMTMSQGAGTQIDAIRLAGLFKLSVPLILKMNDRILDALTQIEELLSFWKETQEYRVHFFLHAKSPKVIVRNLQRIQDELCILLGSLVQHVNKAPLEKNNASQYAWLCELCMLLNSSQQNQEAAVQPVFETVAAMLTRAVTSVSKFTSQMENRLYEYGKPSWIRRNLGTAITTVGGGAAVGVSAERYRDADGNRYVEKAATTIAGHADTYRKACADAVWGDDQKWDQQLSREESRTASDYKLLVSRMLPSFSSSEDERDRIAKEVVNQRLRDLDKLSDESADITDFSHVQIDDAGNVSINASVDASALRGSAVGISDDNEITDLERVFRRLFGAPLPKPKNSCDTLRARRTAPLTASARGSGGASVAGSSTHTVADMNKAANEMDIHYLASLVTAPLEVEGQRTKEALHRVVEIIGKTDLGEANNARRTLNGLFPHVFNPPASGVDDFEYKGYSEALSAIAAKLEGNLDVVDTIAQAPEVVILLVRLGAVKAERQSYKFWKKTKLLVMIGISYFLYRVGKDVVVPPVSYLMKKMRIITYPHEGLLETLRELKKLLLVNGEKQQSQMDPSDVGLMYYLIYRLECVEVPAKYSSTFLNDVRLLQAPELSAKQKYLIVNDVLQEGYPFLRPLSATTK